MIPLMTLFALAPEYFVVRSGAVAILFLEFVAGPIVAVFFLRKRIHGKYRLVALATFFLVFCAIAPSLQELWRPGAFAYWSFWCITLFFGSLAASLLLVQRA